MRRNFYGRHDDSRSNLQSRAPVPIPVPVLGATCFKLRTPGAGARSVETFPGKRLRSAGRFSALLHHLVAHCHSLAIFGTAVANVGADSTNPGMVLGIAQHEICRGPADLGTLNQ